MKYVSFISMAGRYYYEATVTDEGLCRVGWSTDKATLDLGTDKFGFGFGGTGKKSWGKQFDSYGEVRFLYLTQFTFVYGVDSSICQLELFHFGFRVRLMKKAIR